MPTSVPALLKTPGFHGRSAAKDAPRWLRALQDAASTSDLPPLQVPSNSPPPPQVWADRDPVAAARLATAQARVGRTAEALNIPTENLLTPDTCAGSAGARRRRSTRTPCRRGTARRWAPASGRSSWWARCSPWHCWTRTSWPSAELNRRAGFLVPSNSPGATLPGFFLPGSGCRLAL